MTSSDFWRLDGSQGQFHLGDLAGTVDISRPGRGLHGLQFAGHPLAAARLLAVHFLGEDPEQEQPVADVFLRGRDLVVTYAQLQTVPVRLQICCRVQDATEIPGCLAAIDLQVSVQTSLWHAWPALVMTSHWPARDVVGGERPISAPANESGAEPTRAGYWSCRTPGVELKYLEMVHPADVEREELVPRADDGRDLVHQLFAQPLEKGVIFRARARGAFLSAAADTSAAAAMYEQFLAAPLPLTT